MNDVTPQPILWIAENGDRTTPSIEAERSLSAWARARGIRLTSPAHAPPPVMLPPPDIGAVEIETSLAKARDALVGFDASLVEHALAHAERLLRERPYLPQSSWLMAEIERIWATRWTRLEPKDATRGARAWARAAALDGDRLSGIGEQSFAERAPAIEATLVVDDDATQAWLDGHPVMAGRLKTTEGEHHLVYTENGIPLWSNWISIAAGATLHVALPFHDPCGASDLRRVQLTSGEVDASGVRCARWAVARADSGASIQVASCEGSVCGPFVAWTYRPEWVIPPPSTLANEKSSWPAWATWTLVGAGAFIAAGVTVAIVATRSTHSTEVQFINGGASITSTSTP